MKARAKTEGRILRLDETWHDNKDRYVENVGASRPRSPPRRLRSGAKNSTSQRPIYMN